MDALFLKLLNLSLTASWLILAIVVLRLVFRKAPRWIFCLLWGLVALRLVVPFSLESALSLIPSAQPLPDNIIYTAAPAIDSGVPLIDNVVNPVLETTLTPATPIVSANPTQIWSFVLSCVWVIGIVIMLGYALVSYLLLRRRVATATLLRENIKQSERVDSPFVLGLLRPTIYLPYAMDEGDMGHVIAHERAHIRRGDHWWKPLGFLILAVYWFNPLVWVAYILFCRDMELACDEKVAANLAHEERQAYSTALLHCGVRRRTVAACPLAFGEVGVKSRVKSVMHYKKPAFWVVLIAVVACIVVAVCFLTVPKDDGPHTLEVTGLPAPESGADPYENLEPAERAAAFLKNADQLSYELDPIRMHGTTLVPVLEYVPGAANTPTDPETAKLMVELSHDMLDRLHGFDLSALNPLEIEECTSEYVDSAVIHVGDARCRVAVWSDETAAEDGSPHFAIAFTFTDGTMCVFDGGSQDGSAAELLFAIQRANSGLGFSLHEDQTPGSRVTVTELATGERQNMSAPSAAYVECVFENTPRVSEQVKSEAEFPWKIEILDGGTYWYNPEEGLILTENNKVYAIGGFEPAFSGDTRSELLELMIPGSILSPFGYQVSGSIGGNLKIEPPSTAPEPSEPIADTKPENDTNQALEQAVWQVTVDGGLSPEDAAREMAQKIADNYMALPDEISWKPEGIRVTNAEVFDHYWGETPQFCFRIGLDVKMTREMMMSIHWGAWGGVDEDGDGWWPYGAEVHVIKGEDGNWLCNGWGTGGGSVLLNDGEGLAYLVDCFWLTEGWTHDWRLPYSILDMTDEQLKELPALLDQRTEAEAKEFCAHLGNMLREYDYWVQSIETLKPILGRYGTYLDA